MSALVNGYMVVCGPGRFYNGVHRLAWPAISKEVLVSVPPSLRHDYERACAEFRWWPTLRSSADCRQLAARRSDAGVRSEVIGIYSPCLHRVYGREPWIDATATPLGFDVVSGGGWSLLLTLAMSGLLAPAIALSDHGLLLREEDAGLIERDYRAATYECGLEPLFDDREFPAECVTVSRPMTAATEQA